MQSPFKNGGVEGPDGFLFEITGGDLSLDFVNTVTQRPTDHPKELLPTPAELFSWARQVGVLNAKQEALLRRGAERRVREADRVLKKAKELRECLFSIFRSLEDQTKIGPDLLRRWNGFVQQAMDHYELIQSKEGFTWQLRIDPPDFDSVLWPVVLAAIQLTTGPDVRKIRHCSAPTCDWLFLDTSKRGNRRWCDMRVCGNRAKAQRFYQRKKESSAKKAS